MSRKTTMFGVPVTLLSSAEAEASDRLVCLPWSNPPVLPDNEKGVCCACGHAVQFRPTAPRRPPRFCVQCALAPLH